MTVSEGRLGRPSVRIRSGRGRGLRPAAAAGDGLARQLPRAVVAEIGLLRAAAGVGEVEAHRRAFSLLNFAPAVVADEHGLACQIALLGRSRARNTTQLFGLVELDANGAAKAAPVLPRRARHPAHPRRANGAA